MGGPAFGRHALSRLEARPSPQDNAVSALWVTIVAALGGNEIFIVPPTDSCAPFPRARQGDPSGAAFGRP